MTWNVVQLYFDLDEQSLGIQLYGHVKDHVYGLVLHLGPLTVFIGYDKEAQRWLSGT